MKIASITLALCIGSILSVNVFMNTEIVDPEEMILGKWQSEENPGFVWHFYDDSTLVFSDSGHFFQETEWSIVHECEGETADNEEDFAMLEVLYSENDTQCYVVQGLNGVLTLLAIPQSRLLMFDRMEKQTDDYASKKTSVHQDTIQTAYQVFEPVVPILSDKTIPLRLPSYLAVDEYTNPQKLYALAEDTPQDSYSIQISVLPECNWNNFCIVGAIHGERIKEMKQPENSQPVTLSRNIEGFFIESECHAYCNRAKIIWFENNVKYTVEDKAAPKQTMIRIANSAIEHSLGN